MSNCKDCKWFLAQPTVEFSGVCNFPLPSWFQSYLFWHGGERARWIQGTGYQNCPSHERKQP